MSYIFSWPRAPLNMFQIPCYGAKLLIECPCTYIRVTLTAWINHTQKEVYFIAMACTFWRSSYAISLMIRRTETDAFKSHVDIIYYHGRWHWNIRATLHLCLTCFGAMNRRGFCIYISWHIMVPISEMWIEINNGKWHIEEYAALFVICTVPALDTTPFGVMKRCAEATMATVKLLPSKRATKVWLL